MTSRVPGCSASTVVTSVANMSSGRSNGTGSACTSTTGNTGGSFR
ncbi:hypothetical protein [Kutzneria kofuensis]